MASAVAELETGLQAMSTLKAPGVSGTRISSLTALCVANVQSESVLIQKIYTHFKKTDGDHKLGVLYVVDSVTRKWLEQAKSQGQAVDGSARDGTFAAGVHRVTELMPVLMNDIISSAPANQKEKISKLLDIWEKGQTFPQPLLDSFRSKLASASLPVKSTTPDGSPPPHLLSSLGSNNNMASSLSANSSATPTAPPAAQNGNAIMEALAKIARQNVSSTPGNPSVSAQALAPAPAPAAIPTQQSQVPNLSGLAGILSSLSGQQSAPPATSNVPSYTAPQHPAAPPSQPAFPFQMPPQMHSGMPGMSNSPAPTFPGMTSTPPTGGLGLNPDLQQQVMLIKVLAEQGVPFDKIPALIQTMQAAGTVPPQTNAHGAALAASAYQAPGQSWNPPPVQSNNSDVRDPYGYNGRVRSPDGYNNRRSRSRSPGRRWDSHNSPRGSRDDHGSRRHDDRSGSGRASDFRQRSPVGRRTQGAGSIEPPAHDGMDKYIEYDNSIQEGNIRVFSRTLFVGGVTCSETELRDIFSQYGEVQTCIVNKDKRHAFVKMLTRKDAVAAKEAMEFWQGPGGLQLRTRWGVGFGPRHCSDYATGVSIIPISALTQADRKWMVTAEFGGSGGKPIESGLVVEEPDIEIGAGVSSKAISRRMQTDKGGSQGPKSTRIDGGRPAKGGRRDEWQPSGSNAQPLPQQFPYGINTMPNGMPDFPQGFAFPAPNGHSNGR